VSLAEKKAKKKHHHHHKHHHKEDKKETKQEPKKSVLQAQIDKLEAQKKASDKTKESRPSEKKNVQLESSEGQKSHHKHHHHHSQHNNLAQTNETHKLKDDDDIFGGEQAEDASIMKSIEYAESKLNHEMGTP